MAFSPLPSSLNEALKEIKMWREKFTKQKFTPQPKQEQRNVTKDEHDVLMKALAKSGKVVDAGFLAKQEQGETVAVMELHAGGWDLVEDIDTDWLETLPFGTKLYTTPQQRTWVGLTDEDKKQIAKEANYNWEMTTGEYAERIGRLTEAKLKEKNT